MTLAVNVIDENESEPQFKDKGTCIMLISTVVFFFHGFLYIFNGNHILDGLFYQW